MSNQHVLKIHHAPLADLLSGAKTAEVRRNDRGFQVGDTVRLMEVNPETLNWTGRPDLVRTISHIQTGYGLPDGLCVLSYAQAEQQEAGHGHVTPRADGVVMKCGGPGLCAVCTAEQEAQGAQARDEHENFEAWHRSVVAGDPPHEKYHDGSYVNQHVNRYWTGWQARAALATQPAALPTDPADWPLKVGADEFVSQQAKWPDTDPSDFMHDALYEMICVLTQPAVRGAEHDQ